MNYKISLRNGRELIVDANHIAIENDCAILLDEKENTVAAFPVCELLFVVSDCK